MRKTATIAVSAAALAVPFGSALASTRGTALVKAAKPKKRVTSIVRTITGTPGSADRWGDVEVTLVVKKTTTTVGGKTTVARRITDVKVPVYPNHTGRSVFISEHALPLLVQETLQLQFDLKDFRLVSGATYTSDGFGNSLQSALLRARKL